jgi:amino acid permease
MKLLQVVLISLSAVFLVIGIDQSLKHGFYNSYFIFMFMLASFFGYTYVRGKALMDTKKQENDPKNQPSVKATQKSKKK